MREITRDDFIGFPEEVTTVPVYDDEDGGLLGWGHIEPSDLINALPAIAKHYGMPEGELDDIDGTEVYHLHAKPNPIDGLEEDEIAFIFCESHEDGAFPITYLEV